MNELDINMPIVREFEDSDYDMIEEFFNQMSGETRALFNRADGNRILAMSFFEGNRENIIRYAAVIENNNKPLMVGYLFLWDLHKKTPWLGIALREEWKGQKLGRRLMEFAKDYTIKNNYGGILLTTAQANIRGQGLYERCGYERLGTHSSGEIQYILRLEK